MRPFSINIRGRVKNFNLPKNQPLVPLFEAIVNAIYSPDMLVGRFHYRIDTLLPIDFTGKKGN